MVAWFDGPPPTHTLAGSVSVGQTGADAHPLFSRTDGGRRFQIAVMQQSGYLDIRWLLHYRYLRKKGPRLRPCSTG